MSTIKSYTWLYDLKYYAMSGEVNENHVAVVQTMPSITIDNIAQAIVSERTEYRLDTIIAVANLIEEKIRQFVCQGHTIVTGTARYSPSITGLFTGTTGAFDAKVNACTVNLTASKALREEVEKVKPVFSGYVQDLGGARIGLVTDCTTGLTDGTITPGGILDVVGNKIKCLNADGSGIGKVSLVNTKTQAETDIPTLVINNPSRLLFSLPVTLPQGTYRLRVETYFSTGAYLKAARTIEYNIDLVTVSTDGDGNQVG